MKNNIAIVLVIVIFVAGGAGFFGGMKYQQSKQPSRADFQARVGMRQGVPGAQQGAGTETVRGEIVSQDEESITVKLPDESSKIILISENTAINKATEGSVGDLETGEQVMVFGKANSDGSIAATQIQLNFGLRGEVNQGDETN